MTYVCSGLAIEKGYQLQDDYISLIIIAGNLPKSCFRVRTGQKGHEPSHVYTFVYQAVSFKFLNCFVKYIQNLDLGHLLKLL